MGTNTPIQNTPYETQGYEIKLTAERIEALLRALDTADAAEELTGSTLEDLNAIIGAIKDWDKSDDDLGVKEQLINIYTKMLSEEEFNKAKEELVSKEEFESLIETKMDGYTELGVNADLDNLDDGWYHLPGGHNSFGEALGHNYPHTLYQTSAETSYTVQIAMCPQSIMWRGGDDGYWKAWKKIIDETDILSLKKIPIESGVGENSIQIKNSGGVAIADDAISVGEECVAGSKAFYIAGSNNNSYTLDSIKGLEVGDVCSALFLDIMNGTGTVDRVFQDFGKIKSINTSTNTITFDVAAPTSSDPTMFVGFMCVLKKPNIGTQMTGIGAFCGGLNGINLSDFGLNYGTGCLNVGKGSFVGGLWAKALNIGAFSWGNTAEAIGANSHAENNHTIAKAGNTHAEGDHTIAGSTNQHVQGKFNIEDKDGVYADIVGNGTDEEHRSNAYTLDWDGNGRFSGDVTVTINGASISISSLLSRIVYLENFIANL